MHIPIVCKLIAVAFSDYRLLYCIAIVNEELLLFVSQTIYNSIKYIKENE